LHPSPFANDGLPMGVRKSKMGAGFGMSVDCLVCHGGSVFGQSYVGLGNSTLDIQALFEDLNRASGIGRNLPFTFSNVRGTSEAGGMAVFLLGYRNPDLSLRLKPVDLELFDNMCEDAPPWWNLKKKRTMYHTGGADTRSVRSLMQFMMSPLNSRAVFEREEATFRDVQAYLKSLESPKYPLPIDRDLASKGQRLFERTCAGCHGKPGPDGSYPNKVIALDEIGTDPRRYEGITETFEQYYNRSWFAKEKTGWLGNEYTSKSTRGYQAPPLDGLWASAPYFHNGSAPTVYHVLKSTSRPSLYTRSFRTGRDDYDSVKLGWKVTAVEKPPGDDAPPLERRKVYDTTKPGRSNAGHTFGDDLTEDERMAVIEYLKTL
jgi:mono/diheme cytochrome c family protein